MLTREDTAVGAVTLIAAGTAIAAATHSHEVGPILAFVGALMVALIAAYTASRRQQQQLNAEHVRQEQTLNAERERLEARLAHEREQTDLLDLRAVLEQDLAFLDGMLKPLRMLWRGEVESSDEIDSALERVSAHLDRLHVRLGPQDPLVCASESLGQALIEMRRLAIEKRQSERAAPGHDSEEYEARTWHAAMEDWHKAYAHYVIVASGRIGSRLPA